MRSLLLLLILAVIITVVIVLRPKRVNRELELTRQLRNYEDLEARLLSAARDHIELGEPLAQIVLDEIRQAHRRNDRNEIR